MTPGAPRHLLRPAREGTIGSPSRAGRAWPRVVAFGGGTGLPIVLRGLKAALFPPGSAPSTEIDRNRLTAVVTVADDGGSSGRLRDLYGVPAPGDARNCLIALSDNEPLVSLFGARFRGAQDVGGHSLGNLMLLALHEREGDFLSALDRAAALLGARGRVLPCTPDDVRLVAEYSDGSVEQGESRIAMVRRRIRGVCLRPEAVRVTPPVPAAIAAADLLVLSPGSLYTSLLPVLLVRGIAEAIGRSGARVVLVMNLMTEPGETDGYGAVDIVRTIRRHAPEVPIHDVLLNNAPIAGRRIRRYASLGSLPVAGDAAALSAIGCGAVERDLLRDGPLVRHDPMKLARALLEIAAGAEKSAGQADGTLLREAVL